MSEKINDIRDKIRKEDISFSNKILRKHIYNMNVYRYINHFYEDLYQQYSVLHNIFNKVCDTPNEDWFFYMFDYLHYHLDVANSFLTNYKNMIIEDVSISNKTGEYLKMISSCFYYSMSLLNIFNDKNDCYVYYLYQKSLSMYDLYSKLS